MTSAPRSEPRRLRVVIVNDSSTMRASLRAALLLAPDLEIVAEVSSGADAAEAVAVERPSIVLMDVVMPGCDGYAATRQIMARSPTPIVMVSSIVDPRDSAVVLEALAAGALSVAELPPPPTDPAYRRRCAALAQLLRAMAAVNVTRSRSEPRLAPIVAQSPPRAARQSGISAIGIVASTGGPKAVVEILAALPRQVMPPILLVQHIAPGFAPGFTAWVGERTGHRAKLVGDGALLEPGTVYIAPDDRHLGVTVDLRAALSDDPPIGPFRPSGTFLLRSLARSLGRRALGVVLTGMADDGADGAVALRRAGGRTAAQDHETSVIYGMPKAAFERGGVDDVLPLGAMAAWLSQRSGIS